MGFVRSGRLRGNRSERDPQAADGERGDAKQEPVPTACKRQMASAAGDVRLPRAASAPGSLRPTRGELPATGELGNHTVYQTASLGRLELLRMNIMKSQLFNWFVTDL